MADDQKTNNPHLRQALNALHWDERLSARACHVGQRVVTYMNDSFEGAFPTVTTLAADLKMNRKYVIAGLDELVGAGWFREALKPGGRGLKVYSIADIERIDQVTSARRIATQERKADQSLRRTSPREGPVPEKYQSLSRTGTSPSGGLVPVPQRDTDRLNRSAQLIGSECTPPGCTPSRGTTTPPKASEPSGPRPLDEPQLGSPVVSQKIVKSDKLSRKKTAKAAKPPFEVTEIEQLNGHTVDLVERLARLDIKGTFVYPGARKGAHSSLAAVARDWPPEIVEQAVAALEARVAAGTAWRGKNGELPVRAGLQGACSDVARGSPQPKAQPSALSRSLMDNGSRRGGRGGSWV